MTTPHIRYVFDPLSSNTDDVERVLCKLNLEGHSCHIFDKSERLAIYNNGNIKWELNFKKKPIKNLTDESNHAKYEMNIIDGIKKNKCLNEYIDIDNFTIQKLDKNVIETTLSDDKPIMFSLSKVYIGNYYDLIIFNENEKCRSERDQVFDYVYNNNEKPLCYNCATKKGLPYLHSGDIKTYAGDHSLLIHMMKPLENKEKLKKLNMLPKSKSSKGTITAQAYNKKSFFDIIRSDPSICIPDYVNNIIYFIPCPLTIERVGDSDINHIVKYTINYENDKIQWIFPLTPVFNTMKMDVGIEISNYLKGLETMEIECKKSFNEYKKQYEIVKNKTNTSDECEILKNTSDKCCNTFEISNDDDDNNTSPLLIVQEGINIPYELLAKISPEFQFGRGIYEYNANDSSVFNEHNCALPLASGSILYDSDLLMYGESIKDEITANRFRKRLKNASRVIVIVGDDYNINTAPKCIQKLNAIFIVVASKPYTTINDINVSMALVQQASLSIVLCYINNCLLYYRGIWDSKTFGDKITIDLLFNGRVLRSGLVYTNERKIYNYFGEYMFKLELDHEVDSILQNYETITETKENFLVCLAQLEVMLTAAELRKVITKTLELIKPLTHKHVIQYLVNHPNTNMNVKKHLKNIQIQNNTKIYNLKLWVMELCQNMHSDMFCMNFEKTFTNIFKIVKEIKHNEEWFMTALRNTTSSRSSYGVKSHDMVKNAIRKDAILANVECARNTDLDQFLEDNCNKLGVIIFEIDKSKLYELVDKCNKSIAVNESYFPIDEKGSDSETNNFFSIDHRCHDISGMFAGGLLQQNANKLALEFTIEKSVSDYRTEWKNNFLLPLSDGILDIVSSYESIKKYNWREIKEGDPIQLLRIIVRGGVHSMVKDKLQVEASHPMVGRLVLYILIMIMNKIKSLFQNQTTAIDENSGLVKKMRCLLGLILSLMSSGTNIPLCAAYKGILYQDATVKYHPFDKFVVDSIIKAWPYFCFEINQEEIINNMLQSLQREANRILFSVNNIINSKKANCIALEEMQKTNQYKSKWLFEHVRPICLYLLSPEYTFLEKKDDEICQFGTLAQLQTLQSMVHMETQWDMKIATTGEELLEKLNPRPKRKRNMDEKETNKRKKLKYNMNETRFGLEDTTNKRKLLQITYPDISKLKTLYENAHTQFPNFTMRSRFMNIISDFLKTKRLENISDDEYEEYLGKKILYIKQAAHDKYMKCANLFYYEKFCLLSSNGDLQKYIKRFFYEVYRMQSVYSDSTQIKYEDRNILKWLKINDDLVFSKEKKKYLANNLSKLGENTNTHFNLFRDLGDKYKIDICNSIKGDIRTNSNLQKLINWIGQYDENNKFTNDIGGIIYRQLTNT
nr:MAG: hypothetical protein [Metapenaeopsis lamellata majanivirus]